MNPPRQSCKRRRSSFIRLRCLIRRLEVLFVCVATLAEALCCDWFVTRKRWSNLACWRWPATRETTRNMILTRQGAPPLLLPTALALFVATVTRRLVWRMIRRSYRDRFFLHVYCVNFRGSEAVLRISYDFRSFGLLELWKRCSCFLLYIALHLTTDASTCLTSSNWVQIRFKAVLAPNNAWQRNVKHSRSFGR